MDGFINTGDRRHTRLNPRSDARHVTKADAHHNQKPDNESLYHMLSEVYEGKWLLGTIHMIIISPLLICMLLFTALWNLNLFLGFYSPPWYRAYMEGLEEWSMVVVETTVYLSLVLLEEMAQIIPSPLCTKIFMTIPLVTTFIYAAGFLPKESGLMVPIAIHDAVYLGIYFFTLWDRGRWIEQGRTRILINVMFLYWTGRIGYF